MDAVLDPREDGATGEGIPRLLAALAVCAVAGCATGSGAPGKVASHGAPVDGVGCLDTLHAADSITAVLKMVVGPRDSGVVLPPDFESVFAEEFRTLFRVPAKMPLSIVRGVPPCDSAGSRCTAGMLDIGAFAYATAHDNGKLTDIAVIDVALTHSFADSVGSALESMSRGSLVPLIGKPDSVPLIIQLEREDEPDTVPIYRQIFKVRLPRYDLPFAYATMPAAGVTAKYPFTARIAGVGDSVTVAYTVQSDGTIPSESIELVKAGYRDFVAAVANALLSTRYHPARLGDCAVATRMEQRFLFRIPD